MDFLLSKKTLNERNLSVEEIMRKNKLIYGDNIYLFILLTTQIETLKPTWTELRTKNTKTVTYIQLHKYIHSYIHTLHTVTYNFF